MEKTVELIKELHKLREDRTALDVKISLMEESLVQTRKEEERLWDKKEVAAYLGVTVRHVDDMRYAGKIKARNISGCIRFNPDEIKALGA